MPNDMWVEILKKHQEKYNDLLCDGEFTPLTLDNLFKYGAPLLDINAKITFDMFPVKGERVFKATIEKPYYHEWQHITYDKYSWSNSNPVEALLTAIYQAVIK